MLPKIALRNIRKSIRDYAIYFVTLTIGVAIFYAFNSIGSQGIMFDLESVAEQRQLEMTQGMLNLFSGLIACVLGFLVLYANRFLIRRRKKEFGTYLLLGMSSLSVSGIVLMETILVGIGALALGLLFGVLASQVLSFFTASLFDTIIVNYTFVFSEEAFVSTLLCFALIFVVVALFNTLSVNRYKLIDLLSANKKNERGGVRNPWLCFAVFLIAVGVLMYAYLQLIESGIVMLDDPRFMRATIAMLIGTFLFFWSIAGFVICIVTRMRGIYLKGLTAFTTRQIASKINTAFVSLWAVCVMLFFSITTFSCGMGLVEVFTGSLNETVPFDTTLRADVWYGDDPTETFAPTSDSYAERAQEMKAEVPERFAHGESYAWDMAACLESNAPELWEQTVKDCAQINFYETPGYTYGALVDAAREAGFTITIPEQLARVVDSNIEVIPISALNAAGALVGKESVQLQDDQCVLVNNMDMSQSIADDIVKSSQSLDILGHKLNILPKISNNQLDNNAMKSTGLVFAVPDHVIDEIEETGAIPTKSYLDVIYREKGEASDIAMGQIIAKTQPLDMGGFERGFSGKDELYASLLWPVTSTYTKTQMVAQASGLKMMVTYLALYIGFVFLMATATIIAVQQLSETTDSLPRYRLLAKLGCDGRMINMSIFKQVAIYFLAPLALAICHSVCAIGVLSNELFVSFGVSIVQPVLMAALLVVGIYGGYMLITFLVSKSIVKSTDRSVA